MAVAAQEGAEEETVATLPPPTSRRRWSPGTGRRVVALVAALVVTAAVLTVALSVTNRPNHVPGSSTTAWQPSHPVSRAVVAKATPSSPGALRLVSYIERAPVAKGEPAGAPRLP